MLSIMLHELRTSRVPLLFFRGELNQDYLVAKTISTTLLLQYWDIQVSEGDLILYDVHIRFLSSI